MRSAFDFSPFRRSTVGFDRLFDMLENSSAGNGGENYPPFDLIKTGENDYRIELAVAGFKPDEIDITAQQNVLIVSGRKKEESEMRAPTISTVALRPARSSGASRLPTISRCAAPT
jgi:molecular chaperone IbpA